jgi:DNA-binding beta-propeller fold protein YncE
MKTITPGRKSSCLGILFLLLVFSSCTGGRSGSGGRNGSGTSFTELLIVTNSGSGTVSSFGVDQTTEALTPAAGSPFPAGSFPFAAVFHPNNKFIYVSNFNSRDLSAYAVDISTGMLTPLSSSPIAVGNGPRYLAITPAGTFLYVADQSNQAVSAFSVDAGTGALTPVPGSPFPAGNAPYAVAIDGGGKFLYVTDSGTGELLGFAIQGDGSLVPVPGSPFPVGSDPEGVTVAPAGNLVYVSNATSNDISAFTFDAVGTLTAVAGSPFPDPGPPGGARPEGLTTSPTGNLLFVANEFGNSVGVFSIAAGGGLTPVTGSPFALSGASTNFPFGLAIDSSGKSLFVAVMNSNEVAGFSVDSGGNLTPVAGSPFATGPSPTGVAISH